MNLKIISIPILICLLVSPAIANEILIPNIHGEQSQIVEIPIILNSTEDVLGTYTNITYDSNAIEIIDIVPGSINFESYKRIDEDTIGYAVVNTEKKELPTIKVIGTIVARIKDRIGSYLSVNSYSVVNAQNENVMVSLNDGNVSGDPPVAAMNESLEVTIVWTNTGLRNYAFDVKLDIDGLTSISDDDVFLARGDTKTTILRVNIPDDPDIIGTHNMSILITDDNGKIYDKYSTTLTVTSSRIGASIRSVSFAIFT